MIPILTTCPILLVTITEMEKSSDIIRETYLPVMGKPQGFLFKFCIENWQCNNNTRL